MKTLKLLGNIALLTFIAAGSSTFAASFLTTLNLEPGGPEDIDRVELCWSTDLTSGFVNGSALNEYSMEIFSGGTSLFTDIVIVGGVVQEAAPGVARANPFWQFNLDTNALLQLNQGTDSVGAAASAALGGAAFYFAVDGLNLVVDPSIKVFNYLNGSFNYFASLNLVSQTTVEKQVPDSGTTFALMGMVVLGLGMLRRVVKA